MKCLYWLAGFVMCMHIQSVNARELKPGFDADEYLEVLQRCAGQINHTIFPKTADTLTFRKVYTSPEMGFHNRWELWLSKDGSTMAVNLRGTVGALDNGLENLYSAMIPATGKLRLSDTVDFSYKFANDPRALVHVGWTIGICSMIPDIMNHIMEQYGKGIKQVIVEGHSQGGALSFLLRSYLHYQVADGKLPNDLVIKTYASAAPKPGNLYYAYDFDHITRGGWAFTVVSSIDWVPEMPFTVQRYTDVSEVNPFVAGKSSVKKQNFFVKVYLKHVYNKTNRATRRAQRRFEHYLGRTAYRFLHRFMPDGERPHFVHSANYMPAGTLVVLVPDAAYDKQFEKVKYNMFMHHFFEQYYFLVKRIYKNQGV